MQEQSITVANRSIEQQRHMLASSMGVEWRMWRPVPDYPTFHIKWADGTVIFPWRNRNPGEFPS